ncbi:uncharacterized protein LOC107810325 isoform X2 [Nicotiana tabacum]|uniref:Uncharacterized protein LOC107810325 isoform X2 n=2 Tax=Nicotiana TaxID=4085 RepID=A0A1S4BNY9_TOBAC|nr:PREDICTED: uncharacterized protein LOC104219267 isoform X2 [Nicotiana sylvestris]XP_016490575.1 PREDICTED: uncharacterized protein LOC107810325 isoform X2 [Nicotiana tabacum]
MRNIHDNSDSELELEPALPSSHPFFLHPSDNPGIMLVAKQFNGSCFGAWRRGIIIALSAKKKIGFINGAYVKPSLTSSLYEPWEQCNNMVISWILNSPDPDIAQSVIYSKSAKSLWDELNQRYGQSNGARMYEVQKDLSSISQGSSDVSGYFTRIKRLWDEMESLDADSYCVCECTCGDKHKMIKREQNQKLMQFLMGLNEAYSNARGNILMMESLPDISKAYSLIIQDEKQRGIHNVTSYNQKAPQSVNPNQRYNFNNRTTQNFNNLTTQNFNNQKGYVDPKKLFCKYCKKNGHVIEKCYKLHGFPQNFKFGNKNVRIAANMLSSADPKSDGGPDTTLSPNTITPEQYKQIMNILQNVQVDDPQNQNQSVSSAANFTAGCNWQICLPSPYLV